MRLLFKSDPPRASPRAAPGLPLLLAALGLLSSCASTQTYDPTVSDWHPGGGWRPASGSAKKASPEKLRAQSREAFDAAAYRDSLKGYLALRERYPASGEAKDVETAFHIAECYYQLG